MPGATPGSMPLSCVAPAPFPTCLLLKLSTLLHLTFLLPAAYVHALLVEGHSLEFFIEGGRRCVGGGVLMWLVGWISGWVGSLDSLLIMFITFL